MVPDIVVAIDFGTTRSAWAYRVRGQADNNILVRIPDTARAAASSTVKTETAALIGRAGKGELVAFGPAALQQYAEDDNEENALFRWFKIDLCEPGPGQTTVQSVRATSTAGHVAPLFSVITASLVYFKDDVLDFLSSTSGRTVRAADVSWVLTVPAIYDDFAKNFMRQAAHEAGMIDRVGSTKLRLCLEPEAACLAVTRTDNPLTCEAEGKKMMVVDCGGGTVDITTYNILSVDPLKLAEVKAPSGGVWGSTKVDKAFKRWLKNFLGGWFDKIEKTESLVSILMTWESEKAKFPGQDPTRPLRLNFSELPQYGMTFEDLKDLRARHNDGLPLLHRVGGNKFLVTLPPTLVTSFFKPALEKIAECLRAIKRDPALHNLHRVYVVGGFSRCPLLREVVQAELETLTCRVVQAHEPDIAIVKGAIMFAEKATIFNSRKARFTYGQKCVVPFDCKNPEHRRRRDAGETKRNATGNLMVLNAFDVHINIGDDIPANGILTRRGYRPMSLTQTESVVQIYASYTRNPGFLDGDNCFQVGQASFPQDMTKKTAQERGYRVELVFGGPELTVRILHDTEEREIADAVMALKRIPEPAA
ncbi:unnamed protein product [Hapterophycus canaliculatus]